MGSDRVSDLASKKCVPCNSKDLRSMNEDVAKDFITKVHGWDLVDEEGKLKLSQTWKVKSFTKGLELFHAVANMAEAEGHHPDLHLAGWNNVTIEIWTHAVDDDKNRKRHQNSLEFMIICLKWNAGLLPSFGTMENNSTLLQFLCLGREHIAWKRLAMEFDSLYLFLSGVHLVHWHKFSSWVTNAVILLWL